MTPQEIMSLIAAACLGAAAAGLVRWPGRPGPGPASPSDRRAEAAQRREERNTSPEAAMSLVGLLAWREDPDGALVWANSGYLKELASGSCMGQALFQDLRARDGPARRATAENGLRYAVSSQRFGQERLHAALPIGTLESAEEDARRARSEFRRVLNQSGFGYATFDPDGRLRHANQVLREHSAAARIIRGRSMTTENDAELLFAACKRDPTLSVHAGQLPDGGRYLLTQPDLSGASFLHSAFDALDEALLIFDAGGRGLLVTRAARSAFGIPSDLINADAFARSLLTSVRPSPIMGELRAFLSGEAERAPWTGALTLNDGRCLEGRFFPIPGGGTLLRFVQSDDFEAMLDPVWRDRA